MSIAIVSANPRCLNMGDVAMLQVAISRLRRMCGANEIQVFTADAAALVRYCPSATPVMLPEHPDWCTDAYLGGRLHSWLPLPASEQLGALYVATACRMPRLRERLLKFRATLRASDRQSLRTFLDTIEGAQLLLVSGAGGVGDSFSAYSNLVLLALQCAQQRGVPTMMASHGFGTLSSPSLHDKAAAILPVVTRIALREDRASKPRLLSLGVPANRLITTGDDAVEPAYKARANDLGRGLGINLRLARATATSETDIEPVRAGLRQFVSSSHVPLVPLPVARQRDLDATTIGRLIEGLGQTSAHDYELDSPAKVIAQVARCRVVLTGAYHAAVFALAQGIPVVCLTRSQYSSDRFLGLAAQFGCGCHVVSLDDPNLAGRIVETLTQAWEEAPRLREPLLAASVRQIAAGLAAYRSIPSFMRPKRAHVA